MESAADVGAPVGAERDVRPVIVPGRKPRHPLEAHARSQPEELSQRVEQEEIVARKWRDRDEPRERLFTGCHGPRPREERRDEVEPPRKHGIVEVHAEDERALIPLTRRRLELGWKRRFRAHSRLRTYIVEDHQPSPAVESDRASAHEVLDAYRDVVEPPHATETRDAVAVFFTEEEIAGLRKDCQAPEDGLARAVRERDDDARRSREVHRQPR